MFRTARPPTRVDPWKSPEAAKADAKASRSWLKKKRWWPLALVLIFTIATQMGGDDSTATSASASMPPANAEPTTVSERTTPEAMTQAEPIAAAVPAPLGGPELTPVRANALRAAENHLSFSAFSRQGLIIQLSSKSGDAFSVEDATFAADHVVVDWNEQAAKAAHNYLELSPFSRQGLIHQLTSAYGDSYTLEQATYAVDQAGL